ncbi:protein of unknown function [Paraburkholderia dioscoreae]|uniref:Uncharacterized protein n=1 Tax=Paraburkholderia dioscoreae TaxID=2604047 RepID=A0A5Q4ZJE5_9BURK|nr:protein of unknown function [Paraburkholderia dioscoreae]
MWSKGVQYAGCRSACGRCANLTVSCINQDFLTYPVTTCHSVVSGFMVTVARSAQGRRDL